MGETIWILKIFFAKEIKQQGPYKEVFPSRVTNSVEGKSFLMNRMRSEYTKIDGKLS